MAKTIYLKTFGEKKSFFNPMRVWLALGDHVIDKDDTHLLTSGCVTASELEAEAEYLKQLIDKAVASAKRRFRR